MKKILISVCICLFSASVTRANINIDGMGAYTQTGDLKYQYGGGFGVSMDVHNNFDLFARTIINTATEHANTDHKADYSYIMALAGLQYRYPISNLPLIWITSVGAGIGKAESKVKVPGVAPAPSTEVDLSETGACIALWTGILFNWTQHLSPFIEVGYHKSFYNADFKDASIGGFQILVGLRFTIGKNKSIFEDY